MKHDGVSLTEIIAKCFSSGKYRTVDEFMRTGFAQQLVGIYGMAKVRGMAEQQWEQRREQA